MNLERGKVGKILTDKFRLSCRNLNWSLLYDSAQFREKVAELTVFVIADIHSLIRFFFGSVEAVEAISRRSSNGEMEKKKKFHIKIFGFISELRQFYWRHFARRNFLEISFHTFLMPSQWITPETLLRWFPKKALFNALDSTHLQSFTIVRRVED